MKFNRKIAATCFSFFFLASSHSFANESSARTDGVKIEKESIFTKLVPSSMVENQANSQYADLKRSASDKRALAPDSHPQVIRLRNIAKRIIPYAIPINPRSREWKWEVNLIGSKQINAFCMPGGKIAFYSGILESLQLNDDEIAMIMGHEIAHALREHARERMGKSTATNIGTSILGQVLSGSKYGDVAQLGLSAGGSLLKLNFSRGNETEADTIGLDIAARAGFDPRAGISLWQKMSKASKGAPPQWLSTHPSGNSRIEEIKTHLPEVMPLYARAIGVSMQNLPPYHPTNQIPAGLSSR